jgi:hypothetical protein
LVAPSLGGQTQHSLRTRPPDREGGDRREGGREDGDRRGGFGRTRNSDEGNYRRAESAPAQ